MLRLAAPAVRVRLAGSAGVVRCRMLLMLRPRWSLPGEPVHLRRVGAHHAAGAAKAHGCPQLRSPAGARRFVLRTRPCLPRRGGARAMRIQCSPPRTVRLNSRAGSVRRPLAAGDAQAGRQVPLTRAIAHPAAPPPSRPIRATRVSRRLPLDVGTCTPNGPKPGWLVAASFSRRRCVLRVPRFPRAHVHMHAIAAGCTESRSICHSVRGRVDECAVRRCCGRS
jgi:hypothetical protein